MSSPRLRTQFEKLFEHFNGEDADIQLEDITDVLFCTRRNARIVLNKLAEEGWVEWQPAVGRGKLSHLRFRRNRNDVSENLARRYLEEGKVEQALNVLDRDAAKLTQVIQGYLGVQHQEGRQVVRLPYYRPLAVLNPRKPHRRSEQHIIRQIFSGLTRLDDNEQIQPDLAHQWEALSPNHWRFYVRPGVRFHNGVALTMDHIVSSLEELKRFNLFSHFDSISLPSPWVVDIHLSLPDHHLPLLLTESCAKIMLTGEGVDAHHDRLPVGCGPYRVEINDDKSLVLEAFDGYFGYRPLVDRIEVWVVDEAYSSLVFPSLSKPTNVGRGSFDEVELDPGCTYLLLNRRCGLAKESTWARYFSARLSAFNLFRSLSEQQVTELGLLLAHGLKPGWHHQMPAIASPPPQTDKKVVLAYMAKHPVFPTIAKSIEKLLKQDGLKVELLRYDESIEDVDNVDIWLKPMGIGTYRGEALAGWLLDHSDISHMSSEQDFRVWFDKVQTWRASNTESFPAKELGQSLVQSHQIIPMFHCWLGVSQDHCGALQNAKCNALGWFDFSEVWVKPKIHSIAEKTLNDTNDDWGFSSSQRV